MGTRETHHTFCRICEALCGIEVTVEDDKIVEIAPDPEHVATQGFGCVKGMQQHKLYDSPDRLTAPMKRLPDGTYVESTWDEALAAIGGKVKQLRRDHHANSIAMYIGTAAGFGFLHPAFAKGFMDGIGSTSLYSSATQDCSNKFAVSQEMYGFPFTLAYPDVERLECLVIVGANPAVSKWSFLQVSNPVMRIREIQERGGKVIVVDPRKTETAKRASQHEFIRPDTDVFFYLAFLNEVIARGAVERDSIARHMSGFAQVKDLVAPWTPERAAEVTQMSAAALRSIVDAYLAADGAALYCSTGVNMGTNGATAFWLQEVINAVTGNLDRPGGALVGRGIFDFPKWMKRFGQLSGEQTSRVGGFKRTNDAFPGGVLADEIFTPGEEQVRALFVTGGNPLMTMPNSGRLRDAFRELELLVTLDIYLNETGSEAHWVLPSTSPFQRPDLPFSFPLFLGLQSRPYLQATDVVVPPQGLQRDEATIYTELARASGVSMFGSKAIQKPLEWALDKDAKNNPGRPAEIPQKFLLNSVLKMSRNPGFDELLEHKHGLAGEENQGEDFLGERVLTEDGRIALAPDRLIAATGRLESVFAREKTLAGELKLITMRHTRTHNSWTHNAEEFATENFQTNHVYLHSTDADERGLAEGDLADVSTEVATLRLPVKVLDTLMPGVCALPHGWGHQHAKGLSHASKTTGVNVNLLAADGPENLESVSGMAHLTGFCVTVAPAAGPLDPDDWSGVPDSERVVAIIWAPCASV